MVNFENEQLVIESLALKKQRRIISAWKALSKKQESPKTKSSKASKDIEPNGERDSTDLRSSTDQVDRVDLSDNRESVSIKESGPDEMAGIFRNLTLLSRSIRAFKSIGSG